MSHIIEPNLSFPTGKNRQEHTTTFEATGSATERRTEGIALKQHTARAGNSPAHSRQVDQAAPNGIDVCQVTNNVLALTRR